MPIQDSNWFGKQKFPLVHRIDRLWHVRELRSRSQTSSHKTRAPFSIPTPKAVPNSTDVFGRATILHAVDSRDARALHIILEAGANPEPQIPEGLFRGDPPDMGQPERPARDGQPAQQSCCSENSLR